MEKWKGYKFLYVGLVHIFIGFITDLSALPFKYFRLFLLCRRYGIYIKTLQSITMIMNNTFILQEKGLSTKMFLNT